MPRVISGVPQGYGGPRFSRKSASGTAETKQPKTRGFGATPFCAGVERFGARISRNGAAGAILRFICMPRLYISSGRCVSMKNGGNQTKNSLRLSAGDQDR
jgi:hypothetical protein